VATACRPERSDSPAPPAAQQWRDRAAATSSLATAWACCLQIQVLQVTDDAAGPCAHQVQLRCQPCGGLRCCLPAAAAAAMPPPLGVHGCRCCSTSSCSWTLTSSASAASEGRFCLRLCRRPSLALPQFCTVRQPAAIRSSGARHVRPVHTLHVAQPHPRCATCRRSDADLLAACEAPVPDAVTSRGRYRVQLERNALFMHDKVRGRGCRHSCTTRCTAAGGGTGPAAACSCKQSRGR